ncbi:MAG: hypothetical protein NUW01_05105 [Gemmatimonadaceae bacterium]|nr:hypothetical protein [Gemmatimonadaceae bacterium]
MSLYDVARAVGILGRVGQQMHQEIGGDVPLAVNKQGALITQDQILEWAMLGRTFHAQQGNAATLVDFAETAYDEDQPQFALRVPTGKVVIPLSLIITLQDQAGTDTHIVWSTTTNDIGDGTSTAATISAMRRDAPHASGCTARSLYTANATAATGLIEIVRFLDPFVAAAGTMPKYAWNIREAAAIPILVGPATLQVHIAATGTAPAGFGEYVWAEFDTPALVSL